METPFWPKALFEACLHAHHPALHSQTEEGIVKRFLWFWEGYPSPISPPWEQFVDQGRAYESRSDQEIFALLQRAVAEGDEEDRVFALFLLGGLATPKARDLLISFLGSPHRKERWASAISLGRLKEERVFTVVQALLLEDFAASSIFESPEELQAAQKAGRLYRRSIEKQKRAQTLFMEGVAANDSFESFEKLQAVQEAGRLYRQSFEEQRQAECSETLWRVNEHLSTIDYEWYLRQRSECALVLGAWGNLVAVPKLRGALQAAWRMEQDWPNYEGPDESGPAIWHFFQDRLVFALGRFGDWDGLAALPFPEAHLLVARIYLILGYLQISDPRIFYGECTSTLFRDSPQALRHRAWMEEKGMELDLFVNPVRVKPLLAEHFGLSPAEQEDYLVRFSKAWHERV